MNKYEQAQNIILATELGREIPLVDVLNGDVCRIIMQAPVQPVCDRDKLSLRNGTQSAISRLKELREELLKQGHPPESVEAVFAGQARFSVGPVEKSSE